MMKRFFLIVLVACLWQAVAWAQADPDEIRDRVNANRVAVYTNVLRLTSEEAQGFWPIFNEYQENKEKVQQQMKPSKQVDVMSDAEVEEYVKKHIELKQRELDLEKDLIQKLRKVISMRKIAKIPEAERVFRRSILEKVQERRNERAQPRREPKRGRG